MNVLFNAALLLIASQGVFCDISLQQECECDFRRPFEWNCDKYYECENGNLFIKDCPDGLHFNQEALICVHVRSTSCEDGEICLKYVHKIHIILITYLNKLLTYDWSSAP